MADQPNPTPQDDRTDVEGHSYKYRGAPSEQPADVEGHGGRFGGRDEEAPLDKPTGIEQQGDADVEGHCMRVR